jgi:hypothetical protein
MRGGRGGLPFSEIGGSGESGGNRLGAKLRGPLVGSPDGTAGDEQRRERANGTGQGRFRHKSIKHLHASFLDFHPVR